MKDPEEHYIKCDKYGGRRLAPACIHFDRYKSCRRRCSSLEKYLTAHPEIKEDLDYFYKHRENMMLSSKFAGKFLPDSKLSCKYCDFTAKNEKQALYAVIEFAIYI